MALYREQVPPPVQTFNQQLLSTNVRSFISTQAIAKVVYTFQVGMDKAIGSLTAPLEQLKDEVWVWFNLFGYLS